MQKIFGKHFEHQFKDWGENWNTPEKIADNILEILEIQEEIDYQYTIEDGHTYLYQLKIEGEIKYLLIGVGTNGFILTAHPYGKNQL